MSNFFEQYLPKENEVDPARVEAMRALWVNFLQQRAQGVELDLSPGTVTGDHVISPLAESAAALEEAFRRFTSDLNLQNVANGVQYNCDFIKAFLGNFGVYQQSFRGSTGEVELTFDSPVTRTLSAHVLFELPGEGNEPARLLRTSSSGLIQVLPPETPTDQTLQADTYRLRRIGENRFSVTLPIHAIVASGINEGSSLASSEPIPGLTSAVLAAPLYPARDLNSLSALAKQAQTTTFSPGATSRYGLIRTIHELNPNAGYVWPVISGDPEMLRQESGHFLPRPAIDVNYRSRHPLQMKTAVVRLDKLENVEKYVGRLRLPYIPQKIVSIHWQGDQSVTPAYEIYSNSVRSEFRRGSVAKTLYEELTLRMENHPSISPALEVVDGNTRRYTWVVVTYLADPSLNQVASEFLDVAKQPAGVSLLVKGFPLVEVTSLKIYYHKRAGVFFNASEARKWIARTLNEPTQIEGFADSEIGAVVRLNGASRLHSVSYSGFVRPSVATYLLKDLTIDPMTTEDDSGLIQNSVLAPVHEFNEVSELPKESLDPNLGNDQETLLYFSEAVRSFFIQPQNIDFQEL